MALGGGTWVTPNKALPGSYINFVSVARASAALSDRGVVTVPLQLPWGPENAVMTVNSGDVLKNSGKLFGLDYANDSMTPIKEIFLHARLAYFYRLNSGGVKASNTFADALYSGSAGNDITVLVAANEASTTETPVYDVTTLFNGAEVDVQTGIVTMADLIANDYVTWKSGATLAVNAGLPMTGGTDGTVTASAYQNYLAAMEEYSFNVMGVATADDDVKALVVAYTKRMRDEMGIKFQAVLFRTDANYEGVISVDNGFTDAADDPSLVYWVAGAEAGCNVNASLLNTIYDGVYKNRISTAYTQEQLIAAIQAGKFVFHRVGTDIRVLEDINTLREFSPEKSQDFSKNQTIRVIDQIGNDIATLFNTRYLGKVPNDDAGRISLWSDIVAHHTQLLRIRAIQDFTSEDVLVEAGETKDSVMVTDNISPVNALAKLYMTVYVA